MTFEALATAQTWAIAVGLVGSVLLIAGGIGTLIARRVDSAWVDGVVSEMEYARWERNAPLAMAALTPDDPALPADRVDERGDQVIALLAADRDGVR